jgi:serine/threonine protein kinase
MEQMRGQVYPASDLYSLGVTCIRLLTQCLPKEDGSDELYDGLNGRWIWRERLPQSTTITTLLGQVLDKLLKDLVKERYQSADEVLQVLTWVTFPSGIDYSKLRELLAFKDWRAADRETAELILKIAGRKKEGSLTVKNIEQFPCKDLRTIDQLWVKYSNGHFGFSIQKRIWQDAKQDLTTFGESVGWRSAGWFNSSWKVYYSLTFTRNAPLGHLPAQGVTVGRDWDKSLWLLHPFFSLVNTCGL